jgi:predicted transglutaminase-like cysteine proteinase
VRPAALAALAAALLGASWTAAPAAAVAAVPARCVDLGDGCRVALTARREAELVGVQLAVNAAIRPASEREAFGVAELWTPIEGRGRGDCDDYALTKLHRLVGLGWPRAALRLTSAVLPDGQDHLVLAVRTDRGDYILDNLRALPVAWTELPYRWLEQEVPGDAAWRALAAD